MKLNDIEVLERIAARYKYRYGILDDRFVNTIIDTLIYVPINITMLLSEIRQYGESLDDKKDFNLHCTITIMNLFAHYKHYYATHQVSRVIIIGFVRDSFFYKQFHSIISIIETICEFMPNVYFMHDIAPIKHTILVGAFISYIHSNTLSGSPCSVHIYSGLNIDKQLLCIIPANKTSYKICKQMGSNQVNFLEKNIFIKKLFRENDEIYSLICTYKSEIERLNVIIGIYFGTHECYSVSEKKHFTFSFKREPIKSRVLHLLYFLENYYNKDNMTKNINKQFIDYLQSFLTNPVDLESLTKYVNRYDYFSHEGIYLHNIMKELYNSVRVKILDYEMSKESEKYRQLIEHPLYANWLLF
jgi:hypothetical protein